ncbi:hypothetical protein CEXT_482821 [Caerostris extrusa]|uniref:Uncharacterized protein n=1 Tax=Caerostris extrusa TaxID=172846 RepID=A0AAV4VVF6_CAEEX|nr:hypothetical protein CEXT_482821 [Caerostris extrusa]
MEFPAMVQCAQCRAIVDHITMLNSCFTQDACAPAFAYYYAFSPLTSFSTLTLKALFSISGPEELSAFTRALSVCMQKTETTADSRSEQAPVRKLLMLTDNLSNMTCSITLHKRRGYVVISFPLGSHHASDLGYRKSWTKLSALCNSCLSPAWAPRQNLRQAG